MKPVRVVLFWLSLIKVSSGADPRVYTVCEILERLEDFGCRMVRVKAKLVSDTDTWLEGDNCPKVVQVGGISFGSAIALRWTDSQLVGCRINFKSDEESSKKISSLLISPDFRRSRVEVLVEGVVETRKPPYALVSRNGARIGFGHLGSAAAQIIVKRVIDVRVTPKK